MYAHPVEIASDVPVLPRVVEGNHSATILLVEDEAFVREVTREVLVSAGYTVLTAINSIEAVEVWERHSEIDFLLSDVILCGEDGCTLARKLQHRNPALRVLLVTGYSEQIARQEMSTIECLPKPFSSSVLLQRIRQIVDHKPRCH
ncbi:MAG: response regulator [Candidatus Sulfotelmatobacter sp.]